MTSDEQNLHVRFVWTNFGLAWTSIWRSLVSPELTNRCGVSAGITTMPREICEIVWLVASEHLYNMTNIGLNIHSDMLCDISRKK